MHTYFIVIRVDSCLHVWIFLLLESLDSTGVRLDSATDRRRPAPVF
jgi:hypothetical protein